MEDDDLKNLIRTNRTALRMFLQLVDSYRGSDPQLSSKESVAVMTGLLRLGQGEQVATKYGQSNWVPDALAFAQFMDQIGDSSISEFLGIANMEEIPGASVEARADAIRDEQIPEREDPPQPQLASAHRRRNNLGERMIPFAERHIDEGIRKRKQIRESSIQYQLGFMLGEADAKARCYPSDPAVGFRFGGIEKTRFLDGYTKGRKSV